MVLQVVEAVSPWLKNPPAPRQTLLRGAKFSCSFRTKMSLIFASYARCFKESVSIRNVTVFEHYNQCQILGISEEKEGSLPFLDRFGFTLSSLQIKMDDKTTDQDYHGWYHSTSSGFLEVLQAWEIK